MKYVIAFLLLTGALLPHVSHAQSPPTILCNVNTAAPCNTSSNPGNGFEGDPAWLAYGKTNAFLNVFYAMFPTGTLPLPKYGVQVNNNGVMASLVPGSTGTWCLTWTSLVVEPALTSCGSGSGTMTSVTVTVPAWLTVSPSTITTSGTFAISGVNQPNNYVLASAPSGNQTVLTPRALVPADVPTLNQNTTGSAGTANSLTATPTQCTSGNFATGIIANGNPNCSGVNYSQLTGGVPTWNQNTTGNAATATHVAYSGLTGGVPTWNQNTTGNAATATALASAPAQCSSGDYSTGITAAGVAQCAQVGASQLSAGALPNGTSATTQTTADNTTKAATDAFVVATAAQTNTTGTAAGLSGTPTLPNGTTAHTQSTADNTTKVATDAFVVATAGAGNTTGTAAGLSGTPALPNGTTATTQATADNTTKLATDAFVINELGTLGTFAAQNYATPPAIGGTTPNSGKFSSVTDTGISGSTQCVHANSAGLLSGTGVDCGASSGTITGVTAGTGLTGGGSSGTVTVNLSTPVSAANGGTGLSALGTGVATALGVNVGSAGAPVVNGGALGTPASGTATNLTGLPVSTGIAGLGTGIAAALAVNAGSAGAPALQGGAASFSGVTDTGITGSTQCLQVNSSGTLQGTSSPCAGSGSVGANPTASTGLTAVNGSATTFLRSDGSPALSQAITPIWTGVHQFTNGTLTLLGASSGAMTLEAPAIASSYVITFPATTDTVGVLGTAQTYTGAKTFTNSDLLLLGSSTGKTTFTSANASATNYTATFPANTGTFAETNLAQTFSALQTFGTHISIGGVTATGATGTGNVAFSISPIFTTPTLGVAAATSLSLVTPMAAGSGGTGASSLAGAQIPVFSGTPVAGHCAEWLSATVVEDAGTPCNSPFGNIADQSLLGNGSGSPANPAQLTLGAGLAATLSSIGVQSAINDQTGTSYAIAGGPGGDAGKVVNRVVTTTCSDTLSIATAANFTPYFAFTYANSPTSIVNCTLTPTTSTIGGLTALVVQPGQSCNVTSDVDGNYKVDSCAPVAPANATTVNGAAVPASAALLGSNSSGQLIAATSYISAGPTFTLGTVTGASCTSTTARTGGATTGSFQCLGTGSAPVTVVINLPTAPNGWFCTAQNFTEISAMLQEGATVSTTSCKLTGTVIATDIILFTANGY
jgi:hypothetical protein